MFQLLNISEQATFKVERSNFKVSFAYTIVSTFKDVYNATNNLNNKFERISF